MTAQIPPSPLCYPQIMRSVENILYAPSQEEGERILGEAMAELEARNGVAATVAAGTEAAAVEGDAPATDEPAAAADCAAASMGGAEEEALLQESCAMGLAVAPEVGCSA